MSTRALFIVCVVAACSSSPPKTYESMLHARLASPGCKRACPVGGHLDPVEPQATHVLEDCCYDPGGIEWSSCAWNSSGSRMSLAELVAPERFAAMEDCGTDGWPDCKASP